MNGRLEGKVAIVTGSTMGIGAAVARRFMEEGARVVINSHVDDAAARALREELGGTRSLFVQADITDPTAMERLAARTLERFGQVDILVNNAGVNVFSDPLELDAEGWRRCLTLDLEGAWNACRAVLPSMLAAGSGSIVNIASVHGHKVIKGCFPYPVAKHGLIGLTRSLGVEYAARGIRVNSISPGLIMTERIEAWLAGCPDPEAERRRQAALLPCGWIGEPKDVANAALFLASDEARFVNAADLLVDGGRSQVYHD
ncbi:SDR family oxidoreductase [Massilia cellulosiltytica]|uniref:SDR family oxidoreductase n=1 Tax=Massilia cellulosiltytica TaxID=2683234 RepID=UPI0039B57703